MSHNLIHDDRRCEPRYKTSVALKVSTPHKILNGSLNNISGGGMEIEVAKEINPNTNLKITLSLDEKYYFKGKVIWTLGDYVNKKWVFRIGIKTDSIHSRNENAVEPFEKTTLIKKILPRIKKQERVEQTNIMNVA